MKTLIFLMFPFIGNFDYAVTIVKYTNKNYNKIY